MEPTHTAAPERTEEPLEFRPDRRYISNLWMAILVVQLGLLVVWRMWHLPWLRPQGSGTLSWVVWLIFDAFMLVGVLQNTLFRVVAEEDGLRFLSWNFRTVFWPWDEITRLERLPRNFASRLLGNRYRAMSGRHRFEFAQATLTGAQRLADIIVERADMDDLGEEAVSLQEGTKHVWAHPPEEEW